MTKTIRVTEPTKIIRVSAPQAPKVTQAPSLKWVTEPPQPLREASNLLSTLTSATNSYKLISDNHCYFLKGITMVVTVRDIYNHKFYTLAIPLTEWFTTTRQRKLEQIECISHHWVLASAPQAPTATQTIPHHLSLGYLTQELLQTPYNILTYDLQPNTSYFLTSLPTAIIDSKYRDSNRDSKYKMGNRDNIKCRIKWVLDSPYLSDPQPQGKWVIKTGEDLKCVEMGTSNSADNFNPSIKKIRVQKTINPLTVSFKLIGYKNPHPQPHQAFPKRDLPELYLADL